MNVPLVNNNPTTTKEVAAMSTPTVSNTIIKWHDEDAFWQCSIEEYRQIYAEGIRFAVCEKMGDIYTLESNGNLHAYVYSGELLAQLIKDYHNESEEENMKSQPNPQPNRQPSRMIHSKNCCWMIHSKCYYCHWRHLKKTQWCVGRGSAAL